MALARCPVCDDVLTLGISVKLHQIIICPTCLSSLQVVCLSPMELELPERRTAAAGQRRNQTGNRSGNRNSGKRKFDSDDLEDGVIFNDYQIERKQRHKSDRPRRHIEKE